MTSFKSTLVKGAAIAALAVSALMATGQAASAHVACNRFGECWHVHDRYTNYPANLGVVFHNDNWHDHHHRWRRDRDDDHGYYRNGRWTSF